MKTTDKSAKRKRIVGRTRVWTIPEMNEVQKSLHTDLVAVAKAFDDSQGLNREVVGWRPKYALSVSK